MLERLAAAAAGLLEEGSADARAAGRRLIWRLARLAGGHEGLARLLARAPCEAERKRRALEVLDAALDAEGFLQAMSADASALYGPDGLFLGQASGLPEADSARAVGSPGHGRRRSAAPVPPQPAQCGGPCPQEPLAYPGMQAGAQLPEQPARIAAATAPESVPGARKAAALHAPATFAMQGYAAAYAARRPRRLSGDSESSGSAEPVSEQARGRG